MPIVVRVDHAARLRHSIATGKLTDQEVLEAYAEMLADPVFDPTLDHLVDLTTVDRLEVSTDCIRGLAELMALADGSLPEGTRRNAAIVATSPEALAAALLYRSRRLVQEAPVTIRFFRTLDAARAWLGGAPQPPL